jgi:hypothetical protein
MLSQSRSDRGSKSFKPLGFDYLKSTLLKMLLRIFYDSLPILQTRSLMGKKLKIVIRPSFDCNKVVLKL